jgi:hypothetical protein
MGKGLLEPLLVAWPAQAPAAPAAAVTSRSPRPRPTQSPPTFDVCVEMVSREQWRVHLDVGWAVDALLVGKEAGERQRRRRALRCGGRVGRTMLGGGEHWAAPCRRAAGRDNRNCCCTADCGGGSEAAAVEQAAGLHGLEWF